MIGAGISLSTLSPPRTGYKTLNAANTTVFSQVGIEPFPFTVGNDVKEREEIKHDTVYRDSVVYKLQPTPYVVVVASKSKPVDTTTTDTSVLPKEATPDTTLHHVKIPVLVSVNDSVVYADSVKILGN